MELSCGNISCGDMRLGKATWISSGKEWRGTYYTFFCFSQGSGLPGSSGGCGAGDEQTVLEVGEDDDMHVSTVLATVVEIDPDVITACSGWLGSWLHTDIRSTDCHWTAPYHL